MNTAAPGAMRAAATAGVGAVRPLQVEGRAVKCGGGEEQRVSVGGAAQRCASLPAETKQPAQAVVDQLRAVITYWHGLRAAGEASGARAFDCAAVEEKEGGELIAKSQWCNGATQQKVQPTATRGTRHVQARAT